MSRAKLPAKLPSWYLELAAEMQAYWPHIPLSDATLRAWWRDLHDIHPTRVQEAYDQLRREDGKYPPNGRDIREVAVARARREGDHRWRQHQNLSNDRRAKRDEAEAERLRSEAA